MGEALKRLSSDYRDRHPEIPWALIAGMRDKLIHGYDIASAASLLDRPRAYKPPLPLRRHSYTFPHRKNAKKNERQMEHFAAPTSPAATLLRHWS